MNEVGSVFGSGPALENEKRQTGPIRYSFSQGALFSKTYSIHESFSN